MEDFPLPIEDREMHQGMLVLINLINALLSDETKRLQDMKTELIEENTLRGGKNTGFLFHGEFWTNLDPNTAKKLPKTDKTTLHPSLHEKGKELAQQTKLHHTEETRLRQGLSMLLRDCFTMQDVRDALPDMATVILPELTNLTRTREEGYPFMKRPFDAHNWKAICDIFAFHVGSKLLA